MLLRHFATLLMLTLSFGCGDPVSNAGVMPPPPDDVPPPTPADGAPNAPLDGGPVDGVPVDGVQPGAEGAPLPAGDPAKNDRFVVAEGEGVEIAGSVAYSGSAEGKIYLDVLDATSDGDAEALRLLHSTTLVGAGPFSITAPAGFGPVRLCAFIDVDDNGPTPADPKAISLEPVVIGDHAVTGLRLELLDDWDTLHADSLSLYQSGPEVGRADSPAGGAAPPPAPVDGEPVAPTGPPQAEPTGGDGDPPPAGDQGQGIEPGMGGQGQLDGERSGLDMSCPYHGLGLAYLTETSD